MCCNVPQYDVYSWWNIMGFTLWHGNTITITGPLWGKSNTHRASNVELSYFIISLIQLLNEEPNCWWFETSFIWGKLPVIWEAVTVIDLFKKHHSHIPQCTIFKQKCAHVCTFLLPNGALWNINLMHYGICEMGLWYVQYVPRNMHTVFALLCFVVVIHWLIFPYPSGLLHWHCGNLTIAPVPAKQPWWIWINTSCEFIMNDYITTTKQSTTKPCAYFLGYTVWSMLCSSPGPSIMACLQYMDYILCCGVITWVR